MWWWESVAWGSTNAMVWVTRAHVGGDQDYFLRLAMAQVCGVVPGVWLFGLALAQQQWGGFVGTI